MTKRKSSNRHQLIKRIVKLLAVNKDKQLSQTLIRRAPDGVIKTICDAALNAKQGPSIQLTPSTRRSFARHRKLIDTLSNRKPSIRVKRSLLQRGSGFAALIPILLSTVLSALGPALFGKKE